MRSIFRRLASFRKRSEKKPTTDVLIVIGQSNAGAASGTIDHQLNSVLTEALFPSDVFSNHTNWATYAEPPLWKGEVLFSDLAPAADNTSGNSPQNAILFARRQFDLDDGERSTRYIGSTVWRGGTPLSWFLPDAKTGGGRPDGHIYDQIIETVDGAVDAAERDQHRASVIFYVIQGEGGEAGRETWARKFDELANALAEHVTRKTGHAPKFLLAQTSTREDGVEEPGRDVDLAQWDVACARSDTSLIGPLYPLRFKPELDTTPGVWLHHLNLDRLWFGEMAAEAWRSVDRTGTWKPLQPKNGGASVRRAGAVVTIPMDVPFGPMQWDRSRVPATPDAFEGFKAYRTRDGSRLAISNVELAGKKIVVSLAEDPGERVTIDHGRNMTAVTRPWAAERGLVYSESPRLGFYWRHGLETPRRPRHYAIKFRVTTPK